MSSNVKVAIRCRPFNKREKSMLAKSIVDISGNSVVKITDPQTKKENTFTFDYAFDWDSTQEQIYNDIAKPVVEQALTGYNGTIFAYGQTGSGKTWSMMGDSENPGIIPRMNEMLFSRLDEVRAANPNTKFLVVVSYLEIYNEVIKDLLNPSDKQLNIREHPEMGVYVQDLAEIVVHNAAECEKLMIQGQKVRTVAATNMNERSSRSHSCFTIKIEQKTTERTGDTEKTVTLNAKINLVDLAGSERASKTGATGETLKQGAAINKSLSALGNVINALAEAKKGHIPYRDSKLTRLLQHSLGGNSATVMLAAISPADDNADESVSTLQYASRAKRIQNALKKNEDVNELLIRQLRDEIDELRKALALVNAGGSTSSNSPSGVDGAGRSAQQLEELIANLEHAKTQSWEEREKLSKLYEEERKRNLESEAKIMTYMQSVREGNLDLLQRMRGRLSERAQLLKEIRSLKKQITSGRNELESALVEYQMLADEVGEHGEDDSDLTEDLKEKSGRMKALVGDIEVMQNELDDLTDRLKEKKTNSKELERIILEERSTAGAQRTLLEEDAALRRQVAEEERLRLENIMEAEFERRLETERARIRSEAVLERAKLVEQMGGQEGDAELKIFDLNQECIRLQLELDQANQVIARERGASERIAQKAVRAAEEKALVNIRALVDAVEEEKKSYQSKVSELSKLLNMAVREVDTLRRKNAELERQLLLAAAWEPNVDFA